jgi:CheY-like chemotaxis protein
VQAFVSYRRADTLFAAHALGYALRLAGHDAFVDTGSIDGGALYPEAIARAVEASNVMLAVIGPAFEPERLGDPTSVVAYEWRRARFHGVSVVPVLVDGAPMPAEEALPAELRWFTRRNAWALRQSSFTADVDAVVAAVPGLAATPRRAARVLWIDDRPAGNERERRLLRPHGIVFDNVVSTSEALDQLANERYDLVITDLGREHSSDGSQEAGAAFLDHPVVRHGGPPVVVYAGVWAVVRRDELIRRGALAATADPTELFDTVLRTLGRSEELPERLDR